MNKICLIRQPSGLGDIIFCLKIAHHYKLLGYEIWWPVISNFIWIKDYIKDYNFYDKGSSDYYAPLPKSDKFHEVYNGNKPIFSEEFIYLPLQFADSNYPNKKIMESKYQMVGIEYQDWVNYFNFERNIEKENELFYNILNLNDGEDYCLVSRNYGSPPSYSKYPINYYGNNKVIELDFINDFTLFDWTKVIERANEIYMIDSSINYLIDKLELKNENLHLFSRRYGNWSEINYIFKTKYNLMN